MTKYIFNSQVDTPRKNHTKKLLSDTSDKNLDNFTDSDSLLKNFDMTREC